MESCVTRAVQILARIDPAQRPASHEKLCGFLCRRCCTAKHPVDIAQLTTAMLPHLEAESSLHSLLACWADGLKSTLREVAMDVNTCAVAAAAVKRIHHMGSGRFEAMSLLSQLKWFQDVAIATVRVEPVELIEKLRMSGCVGIGEGGRVNYKLSAASTAAFAAATTTSVLDGVPPKPATTPVAHSAATTPLLVSESATDETSYINRLIPERYRSIVASTSVSISLGSGRPARWREVRLGNPSIAAARWLNTAVLECRPRQVVAHSKFIPQYILPQHTAEGKGKVKGKGKGKATVYPAGPRTSMDMDNEERKLEISLQVLGVPGIGEELVQSFVRIAEDEIRNLLHGIAVGGCSLPPPEPLKAMEARLQCKIEQNASGNGVVVLSGGFIPEEELQEVVKLLCGNVPSFKVRLPGLLCIDRKKASALRSAQMVGGMFKNVQSIANTGVWLREASDTKDAPWELWGWPNAKAVAELGSGIVAEMQEEARKAEQSICGTELTEIIKMMCMAEPVFKVNLPGVREAGSLGSGSELPRPLVKVQHAHNVELTMQDASLCGTNATEFTQRCCQVWGWPQHWAVKELCPGAAAALRADMKRAEQAVLAKVQETISFFQKTEAVVAVDDEWVDDGGRTFDINEKELGLLSRKSDSQSIGKKTERPRERWRPQKVKEQQDRQMEAKVRQDRNRRQDVCRGHNRDHKQEHQSNGIGDEMGS